MFSYRLNFLDLNCQIELIILILITRVFYAMVQLHRFSNKNAAIFFEKSNFLQNNHFKTCQKISEIGHTKFDCFAIWHHQDVSRHVQS